MNKYVFLISSMILLNSCDYLELKEKVEKYESLYPGIESVDIKEFNQNYLDQVAYEDTFRLIDPIDPNLGGKMDAIKKQEFKDGKKFYKGFRGQLKRVNIPRPTPGQGNYSVLIPESFYFGLNTMMEMANGYDLLNKKVSSDPNKWPIKGVMLQIYNNPKSMGGNDSHFDIGIVPVDVDGEQVNSIEIEEKGIKKIVEVPPYNNSTPCPVC